MGTGPSGRFRSSLPITSVLLALLLATSGCVSIDPQFAADAYRNHTFPYVVGYADPAHRNVMGTDWRLDNFVVNRDGLPSSAKSGDAYRASWSFDLDGDGTADWTCDVPLYDLRFEHRRDGGVVWLRTFPVSDSLSQKELRLLAHDYVDEVAGGSYFAVNLAGHAIVQDVRFATVVLAEEPTTVGGLAAYRVTFDVANVDQLRLDPNSRAARVIVVIVRPPYVVVAQSRSSRARLTTLMVIGYANAPEYFDAHVAEFDGLLSRLVLIPAATPPPASHTEDSGTTP
jgi:hypothetical protein